MKNFNSSEKLQQHDVVLIGFMGAGKTTVGKELAEHFHCPFFDTDREIKLMTGRTILDIFKQGEGYFRSLERKVVRELYREDGKRDTPRVIATGGGLILDPENAALIRGKSTVVYLRANIETLWQRLKEIGIEERPLLHGSNAEKKFKKLFEEREAIYFKNADLVIDTDYLDSRQIVNVLVNILRERGLF